MPTSDTALIRELSSHFQDCELTHLERKPIDLDLARKQHHHYAQALQELGLTVTVLPSLPDHPDCVFVEDTALVLDELAVLTRPGASSRQGEVQSIYEILKKYRKTILQISAPGTMDGGDLLKIERRIYVGLSNRTNKEAVRQLKEHLQAFGYDVIGLELTECLHLKTAVSYLGDGTVILNPKWISPEHFPHLKIITVDPDESFAANLIRIKDQILCSAEHPKTAKKLQDLGFSLKIIPMSELAKAESGLTCSSLIFKGALV